MLYCILRVLSFGDCLTLGINCLKYCLEIYVLEAGLYRQCSCSVISAFIVTFLYNKSNLPVAFFVL